MDQVDAGRFKRLDEAARQAERDAVLVPHFPPLAGLVADQPRFGEHFAFDCVEQLLPRFVGARGSRCRTRCRCRRGAGAGSSSAIPPDARSHGYRAPPGSVARVWTAKALLVLIQWPQSSNPAPSVCSMSKARKPVQSRNRSPSTRVPDSSTSAVMKPLSGFCSTCAILPSTRRTPARLAQPAQEAGIERRVEMIGIVGSSHRRRWRTRPPPPPEARGNSRRDRRRSPLRAPSSQKWWKSAIQVEGRPICPNEWK